MPSFSGRPRRFVLAALTLLFAGCGYVGDPLPPALHIPMPVTDLGIAQVGDDVVLRFTLPLRTTEDLPVDESAEVDLRVGEWENRDWDEGAWERAATRMSTPPAEERVVTARTPADPWAGKRIVARARVAGKSGRLSAWSEAVVLRVLPRPISVPGFGVESSPEGVRVFWGTPASPLPGFAVEIFRKTPSDADFASVASAEGNEWIDRSAQFGETYVYRVRARVAGEERNFVGLYPEPLTITPADTFPPAVPADLSAVAGATAVELSWAQNAEPDFQAYRVYRASGGEDFARIGEATPTPTFSDPSAPRGVALRYRVTSVDSRGNESKPSAAVEITLP